MRPSSVTIAGTGLSAWLPLDHNAPGKGDGIFVHLSATGTYTLEVTGDNIFDPTVTPVAYPTGIAAFTAAAADVAGELTFAAMAIRINASANTGTIKLTVVPRGLA